MIPISMTKYNPQSFDLIKHAGLSEAQAALMEPMLCVQGMYRDANGLAIFYDRDTWLNAQLIRAIFNKDGSAKSPQKILEDLENNPWQPPELS